MSGSEELELLEEALEEALEDELVLLDCSPDVLEELSSPDDEEDDLLDLEEVNVILHDASDNITTLSKIMCFAFCPISSPSFFDVLSILATFIEKSKNTFLDKNALVEQLL